MASLDCSGPAGVTWDANIPTSVPIWQLQATVTVSLFADPSCKEPFWTASDQTTRGSGGSVTIRSDQEGYSAKVELQEGMGASQTSRGWMSPASGPGERVYYEVTVAESGAPLPVGVIVAISAGGALLLLLVLFLVMRRSRRVPQQLY